MKEGQSACAARVQFNTFDIAMYRGHTVERLRRRAGTKKVWHYRIVGRPTKFSSLESVLEEVDYLIERSRARRQRAAS